MRSYIKYLLFKERIILYLLLLPFLSFSNSLSASFTTNPATVGGSVTICKGQTITYTNNSINTTSTTQYNWTFTNNVPSSSNTIGPHTIAYPNAGTFTTTLTLDTNASSYTIVINVIDTVPSIPQIALIDGNFWTTTTFNGQNYFSYCSNDANISGGLFSFTTLSTQTNANTQHILDWGDGSSDNYVGTNLGDTFHFYATAGYFTLTYTVILDGGCISQRIYELYIGAIPTATVSAVGIPTLCNPGSVTYDLITGAQNTPGTIYTFQVNDGSAPVSFNHPPPATITHQFLNSSCGLVSNINNTVYPNSYQASITTSNPCGNSTNAVGPINIQSAPIANFTRTPNNDIVCEGTTIAISDSTEGGYNIGGPPTYTCTQAYRKYWTITGPAGIISTTTSGVLIANPYITCPNNFGYNNNQPTNPGAWLPTSSATLNVTFLLPGDYTITLYTGSNLCGISSISQSFCVAPRVISDFSMTNSATCAPTILTVNNSSSTPGCMNSNNYLWEVTATNPDNCPSFNPGDWLFSNGNANDLAPEITINSPGIYNISLTTSLNIASAGALCQADTKTTTLVVKGKPTTTLVAETICEGSTITLNPNVFNCYATDPVSYIWDFGANPPSTISNINDATPILTFNMPGVYNYTLTISNECGSNSYNSSITVMPSVHLTASGTPATCVNTTIPLNGSITGGSTSGTWTASEIGGTFTPSPNDINPTYTPPLDYIGTITFTLTSDAPLAPCTIVSESFSTVFNTEATANTGTYDPLCEDETLQLNGSIGGAAASATWSSSIGGLFSNINDVNSTYTPPSGYIGDVILTLTTNDPPGPCDAVSDTVTITVLPTPVVNPINDIYVCNNEAVPTIIFSGTSANLFTWTNSNTAIGLVANGTGNISFTATNTSNSPITSTITVTPVNNSSTSFCGGVPTTFTITVNPATQINAIANQTICNNDSSDAIIFSTANAPGNTTYNWTNDTPIIGLAASGNGDIAPFVVSNTTNSPIVATISVTPTYSYNGINCIGNVVQFTITVNPDIQVNPIGNITICNNEIVTPIPFTSTSTGGSNTYQWTNDNTDIGLAANGTGNIGFTATNTTTVPIVATITVVPLFTLNGITCTGNPENFSITVNPSAQINPIASQVLCHNNSTNAIFFSTNNTLGTTVYNWTNDTPGIGLATNGTGDISSFIATNNSFVPIVATISVTPTFTYNGVSCIGNVEQITITVNPVAQVNPIANTAVCNNSTTAPIVFQTNNTGGNTTFQWTNNNTNIGLAANGTGDIISFLATNNSTTPEIATITVTPLFTNNGITCSGNDETFLITVNPTAQVNSIANQTLCNGTLLNAISFTTNNTIGTTTYNWTNDSPSIGLPAIGSGDINAFIANNTALNPVTATITVVPTFTYNGSSCIGNSIQFTITVNPSPVVNFSESNQIICSEENTTEVQLTSTTAAVIFNWTAIQPTGITGVITSGTNTIPIQNLINTTNAPISITYEAYAITSDVSACQGVISNYTITVIPKPHILNENLFLCSGQNFDYSPINGIPNNSIIVPISTNYTWTVSNNPLITGASNGSGTSINQTLINTTAIPQSITYTVTPSAGGCNGNDFTLTFTVLPKPDVLFSIGNQTSCNNNNTLPVQLNSTIAGNYSYTWNATVPSGIQGALLSGTGDIPSQTLINTTNSPLTVTYEAFAVFQNLGSSCTGPISTYEITVNPSILTSTIISNYNGFNISGFGGSNGFIELNTSGGSGSYTFNWTGPNGFTASTANISNLTAGNYTVIINDGVCTPIILNFTLTEPDDLLVINNVTALQDANCFGSATGTLGVTITQESVPPYNFEITNNGIITQSIVSSNINPIFNGLIAGIYNIQITDANGNTKTISNLVISEPTELVVTTAATQISCFGSNDASITLYVIGGTPPYTINWNNFATGSYLNNLAAGTYTATVTDAKGCVKLIQIAIADLPVFMLQPIVSQISCYGETNGSINLGLVGGQTPVSVTWNDGSTAGLIRNNLVEGIYTAIVIDGMGCSIQRTFSIVALQALFIDGIVQNDLDCTSSNSGSINLIPAGGSPPYTYIWSNGATTENLNNITSGNYSVIVTDSRGCTAVGQYTVFRPQPLVVNLTQSRSVNCTNGDVSNNFEVQISGGVPPYQINWSNGIVSGNFNQFMTTTQNGLISVTVTDSNSCANTANYTIDNPDIGSANFSQSSISFITFGNYSVEDAIQFTNLSTGNPLGISWDFGDGSFSTEENPEHTYFSEGNYTVTLTVSYELGCSSTYSILLNIVKGYKLIMPNGFTANNDSINDRFGPAFEGLKSLKLTIYDSWGNIVYFEEGDNIAGWDGVINNRPAENGNYYFKLTASTFFGKNIEENGPFILLK
ncbi:PKD domain-containing protein [Flavobacterium sp.]|uniref:PKD domain-containing protein n=3 Tax=Flavobacterium sp. TaxID=239 RepID=UPI00404741F1